MYSEVLFSEFEFVYSLLYDTKEYDLNISVQS